MRELSQNLLFDGARASHTRKFTRRIDIAFRLRQPTLHSGGYNEKKRLSKSVAGLLAAVVDFQKADTSAIVQSRKQRRVSAGWQRRRNA